MRISWFLMYSCLLFWLPVFSDFELNFLFGGRHIKERFVNTCKRKVEKVKKVLVKRRNFLC